MSFLKYFFSKNNNANQLKLRFSKADDNWRVTKLFEIIYVGNKDQCKLFMENALTQVQY